MSSLRITGGTIHDPANGVDGVVGDIWIVAGRVVEPPTDPEARADRTLDATGMVVLPGGIDMHCHIAGPKVNTARKMIPDDKRRGGPGRRPPRPRSGPRGRGPRTVAPGELNARRG